MTNNRRQHQTRRFYRQIDRFERHLPVPRRVVDAVLARRLAPIRMPLALVLMLGGLVGFLPVLGFWMLPLGIVLLAVDLPFLRAPAGSLAVRIRAMLRRWRT